MEIILQTYDNIIINMSDYLMLLNNNNNQILIYIGIFALLFLFISIPIICICGDDCCLKITKTPQ